MPIVAKAIISGTREQNLGHLQTDCDQYRRNLHKNAATYVLASVFPIVGLYSTEVGWAAYSCFILLLVKAKARKTYQLNVRVSRKINALLVLEKARTGKSMPEIVEDIFREYSNSRKK